MRTRARNSTAGAEGFVLAGPLGQLSASLRALVQPITIASVALLLMNDHVFKHLVPSWLTGKLSDFAGLFFFPYVVLAFTALARLAVAWPRRTAGEATPRGRLTPGHAACTPFVAIAVVFALVKALPSGTAAASSALGILLGAPIQITTDVTDLIGLMALWPSYRLWISLARSSASPPWRRSVLALSLASLAAIATSPAEEPVVITHLVPAGEGIYALSADGTPVGAAFLSTDQGLSWEYPEVEMLPPEVLEAAAKSVRYPKIVCVPAQERVCYRVAGEVEVEASADSGETWETVWSIPASRLGFMSRINSITLFSPPTELDLRATDVAILGEGPEHVVIVATGDEGVVRGRLGLNEWDRIRVGQMSPTPLQGEVRDLFMFPMIIFGETILSVLAGCAMFAWLSAQSWGRLDQRSGRSPTRSADFWTLIAAGVLLLVIWFWFDDSSSMARFCGVPAIILLAVTAFFLTGWISAFRQAGQPGILRRYVLPSVLGSLAVAVAGWLPFALWVLGIIRWYGIAVVIAVAGAGSIMAWCVSRIRAPRPLES